MLLVMEKPADPANDRRTVPRHLRDGEHELAGSGIFGMRAEDLRGAGRGKVWLLAVLAMAAVAAGLWYVLGRV
jgi:hypothetical protein